MGKISVRILRKRDEKAARDVRGWHEAVRRNRIVEMRVPCMASYTDLTNDVILLQKWEGGKAVLPM